jgi:hypothetical protein
MVMKFILWMGLVGETGIDPKRSGKSWNLNKKNPVQRPFAGSKLRTPLRQ